MVVISHGSGLGQIYLDINFSLIYLESGRKRVFYVRGCVHLEHNMFINGLSLLYHVDYWIMGPLMEWNAFNFLICKTPRSRTIT